MPAGPAEMRWKNELSRSVGILAHAWEQKQRGGRIKGPMPTAIPFKYSGPARRPLPPEERGQRVGRVPRAVADHADAPPQQMGAAPLPVPPER